MNTSYDVKLYKIRIREGRANPYNVRWKVDGESFTRVFRTMGLAKGFYGRLNTAMQEGEAFEIETGLPVRMARAEREKTSGTTPTLTFLDLAIEYTDYKWSRLSANGRRSIAEGLRDIALFMLPRPPEWLGVDGLSHALWRWAFNSGARNRDNAPIEPAVRWLQETTRPATDLEDLETIRQLLDALTWTRNSTRVSANYFARRRQVLSNFLVYAVTKGHLTRNPLTDPLLNWERPSELKVDHAVDPRRVGTPEAVRRMLVAVSYVGAKQGHRFVAFFATMYFAMLRPEEAIKLCLDNCNLPEEGWGELVFGESAPAAGKQWTDNGETHEQRPLKHRPVDSVRVVAAPPELVRILRWHVKAFGVAPDGRLFRSEHLNRYLLPSTISRVWSQARMWGLTPAERSRGLLKYPYMLRASGVSLRRTANLPAREVADEAGHSVEVLERTYSKRLDGFDSRWKRQMGEVLGEPKAEQDTDDPPEKSGPQVGHSEPPEAA